MNVKFKIQQKRDKFRILKFEKIKVVAKCKESKTALFGKTKYFGSRTESTMEEWSEGVPLVFGLACIPYFPSNPRDLKFYAEKHFDSYGEAEDYIFQEYGWNGWGAIQEPEWKTV